MEHDVPGTSPEGSNIRDLQGTFREINDLMIGSNSPCITYLFLFLHEEQVF